MKIEILGMGCPKCKKLYENAQAAVKEANVQADVVKVEDIKKMIEYSVMMTPALVIDSVVKMTGRVLSIEEIKKLILEKQKDI